ncbi:tyrosine-protein phosphatase [Rhodococcus kronopolitis]|uniref:Tyrosine-protein phosphatase n=1 Tax=Rhodococcus kronopolitis TaxID=1460226 RepID=A0ABV9FZB1_9NOCA
MSSRTLTKAAAVLVTGGLMFAAVPATASALDLSALDTGSLGAIAPLLEAGSSAGPAAPTASVLKSVANFRDVAGNVGDGYATADGKHLKRGVIYRSNALTKTSDDDKATLLELGLADVYDLRGLGEVADKMMGGEDKLPAGVNYVPTPIDAGDLVKLATTLKTPAEGTAYMEETNRSYVTNSDSRAAFAQVLTALATEEGAQLFHCTSGKDRTGWTAMLLQSIAGVDSKTIMDDYMVSNAYLEATTQKTLGMITAAIGADAAANLTPVLRVEENFLKAGLDQITTSYGTMDDYLTEGLGLSADTISKLKAKLVS